MQIIHFFNFTRFRQHSAAVGSCNYNRHGKIMITIRTDGRVLQDPPVFVDFSWSVRIFLTNLRFAMFTDEKQRPAHSRKITTHHLQPIADFINEHFEGDFLEVIEYESLKLQIVNKYIDREQEPEVVTNVIDHMFEVQKVLFDCARQTL